MDVYCFANDFFRQYYVLFLHIFNRGHLYLRLAHDLNFRLNFKPYKQQLPKAICEHYLILIKNIYITVQNN